MKVLTLLETLNRVHRKLSDSLTTLDMDKHSSGITLLEKRERILKEHSLNILKITSFYRTPFDDYSFALFDDMAIIDIHRTDVVKDVVRIYNYKGKYYFIRYPYREDLNSGTLEFKTINDLINLCDCAGTNLNWNENNESIKKLKQIIS